MAMPSPVPTRWTAERVRALPDDGRRYECIDGELFVTPAPRPVHQLAVQALLVRLYLWCRETQATLVFTSPADVELDPETLVQPDLFVVPATAGGPPTRWADVAGRLLLAVEVLSPTTARADRTVKRLRYQRAGIPEYWIVDVDGRVVERWRRDDARPEIVSGTLAWEPVAGVPALEIDLAELFAEVARTPE